MSRRATARLEKLYRQGVLIGEEFGIAEMIVLVRSLEERKDQLVEECQCEKDRQEEDQPGRPGLL